MKFNYTDFSDIYIESSKSKITYQLIQDLKSFGVSDSEITNLIQKVKNEIRIDKLNQILNG